MDDEPENRGCRYVWDWFWSRDVEDPVLAVATVLLLFLVTVIWCQPNVAEYYIFDTWLDKYAFGCLLTTAIMVVLAVLVLLRLSGSTLPRKMIALVFRLLLLALFLFIVAAIVVGLMD